MKVINEVHFNHFFLDRPVADRVAVAISPALRVLINCTLQNWKVLKAVDRIRRKMLCKVKKKLKKLKFLFELR